jgi:hypothetical protein
VDASAATITPAGAAIAVQARVEVQGTIVAGVLVATSVQVNASNDDDNEHGGTGGGDGFELDGAIAALDAPGQTLTMRGPTIVSYATASFSGGTAADLAVGKSIEIQGTLSPDGTRVIATLIKFGH